MQTFVEKLKAEGYEEERLIGADYPGREKVERCNEELIK